MNDSVLETPLPQTRAPNHQGPAHRGLDILRGLHSGVAPRGDAGPVRLGADPDRPGPDRMRRAGLGPE